MKKFLVHALALLLLIASLLSGCNIINELNQHDPWSERKEANGFYYYTRGEKATILGLVNPSETIEELVIPEKLGGYSVDNIGYHYEDMFVSVTYRIPVERVKKIIINHDVGIFDYSFVDFKGELVINSILQSTKISWLGKIIRFNVDFNDFPNKSEMNWITRGKRFASFDSTGGKQTTYAFLILADDLLPIPEEPTKEGYTFAGWYKDETCENAWNFETDTVKEDITLYAKWD